MKNRVFKLFLLTGLCVLAGCQQPDDLVPPVSRLGLNSVIASFSSGIGEFAADTPENGNEIVIPIPFYYPENSDNPVTEDSLKKMRVRAVLDGNVTINPPLLFMDLRQNNKITVTNQRKEKVEYFIRGEVRKSNACLIEDFSIPSLDVSGVINEATKTISLPSFETDEPVFAEISLSWHATISPDPRETAFLYDEDMEFTVTAHDGVTKSVYTVKKEVSPKLPYGIRANSAKILFEKKLNADLGITAINVTGGIAATKDYVIINTRNENSVVIHAKTGEKVGEFDLGPVKGGTRNFYTTADAGGNVLICNLAQNDGTFKVWRLTSMSGETELYIDWPENTADNIGRKISVYGNINENAIITSPLLTAPGGAMVNRFARWTVVNGVLTSQTPEVITISGLTTGWNGNSDIVYTSATNTNSDYFLGAYSENALVWINGTTNQVNKRVPTTTTADAGNFVTNAVDFVEFNNAKYLTTNWINGFTWGSADLVWLLEVTTDATFTGSLLESCPAVVWQCDRHKYGPRGSGFSDPEPENGNMTGDVALRVSPDGYYLYLYFMFTNGYVVGVQFDCIDM